MLEPWDCPRSVHLLTALLASQKVLLSDYDWKLAELNQSRESSNKYGIIWSLGSKSSPDLLHFAFTFVLCWLWSIFHSCSAKWEILLVGERALSSNINISRRGKCSLFFILNYYAWFIHFCNSTECNRLLYFFLGNPVSNKCFAFNMKHYFAARHIFIVRHKRFHQYLKRFPYKYPLFN